MKRKENSSAGFMGKEIIEFATVGVNFAAMMEQASDFTPSEFVSRLTRILGLLYVKTALLPAYEYDPENYVEDYVDEDTYNLLMGKVSSLLGNYNTFLTATHNDMQYSDAPIAANIAEYLADVYQNVVNLLGIIREENEMALLSAIGRCRHYFAEYWGEHLLAALTALHRIEYSSEAMEHLDNEQNDIIPESLI
ncbi:Uncharacterised protein [Porphyromonas macacae]|uniref:DUF5063 domain-containing protein n=2 Tax=Porphyromonas macacae TaxID=28115 RepID=A0A379E9S6_9PORP|nr:DUF5063 domain-containing protein [Porphyromonas macacae]SUB89084.1 Uncharacterised protein [Porphyromonas macacae]